MTFNIEHEVERDLGFDQDALIKKVIEASLDYEECPYEVEINVILTDNEAIREINNEQRQIDKPTDVLSFPMAYYETPSDFDRLEDEQEDCFNPETGELMLGDIIISLDKVESQAKEFGHSTMRELGFLIAHSMLHLCGYDHMEEEERMVMEQKQREIMDIVELKR
ncbi:MAG: rRNA maturation RNase YbeY [Clostridiales bacterium]|nr:rRNA maturation RNase YbeY [Clostridiales bacterium]